MPSAAAAEAPVREPSTRPYDGDVFAWATTQARLIRDGRFESVDRDGVAEEIESVGRSETSELRRRTQTLLEHLHKLDASAASDPRANWRETVRRSRREIKRLLDDSPSLRRDLAALLAASRRARPGSRSSSWRMPARVQPRSSTVSATAASRSIRCSAPGSPVTSPRIDESGRQGRLICASSSGPALAGLERFGTRQVRAHCLPNEREARP